MTIQVAAVGAPLRALSPIIGRAALPFRFQLTQVASHSLGAINGVQPGYSPLPAPEDLDYQALQDLVAEAQSVLQQLTAEVVNGLAGKEVLTPCWTFTAEGSLMSFWLPVFCFRATTAYDTLRTKGVPVGKLDFLGELSIKTWGCRSCFSTGYTISKDHARRLAVHLYRPLREVETLIYSGHST